MKTTDRPVRRSGLPLDLAEHAGEALFVQIARALSDDIRRGRLRPGARLPGARTLASELAVHRNTVVAAYSELAAEGWIVAREARGSFVSSALPETSPRRFTRSVAPAGVARRPGFDLGRFPDLDESAPPRGALVLSGGVPDVRLAPKLELGRALRRVLGRDSVRVSSYGNEQGHPALRSAVAELLTTTRGVLAAADDVLVTRGSQMALYLIARVLLSPGDVVAVEALGYRPAWNVFSSLGAECLPVPVDAAGLDVSALERALERRPIRALYLTPHHQYPTLATLSAPRRLALLWLAERHRFAIIEDDYDHEFHYEGRPVLPLASADRAGVVLYVGTLSKIFTPGLRVGWVVGPPPVMEAMSRVRGHIDRQGDLLLEAALGELLEDGVVQRHARKARRIYQARRDHLLEALRRHTGDCLSIRVPTGGMALWARTQGIDADAWAKRALSHGVVVLPARRFAFDGRARPFLRLGFASLNERELSEAARRLGRARSSK